MIDAGNSGEVAMLSGTTRRARRQGYSLLIYRGLLNLALLVSIYSAFPGYELVLTLAVLVFSQGINAVGMMMNLQFLTQNDLDDAAERKTRHTILLAAERGDAPTPHFWMDVNERVAEERGPEPEGTSTLSDIGGVLLRIAGYIVGDVITVIVAMVIAG